MKNASKLDLLDKIEKQLKKTPMSRIDIMNFTGKGKTCIITSLQKLREQKRIYIYENLMDSHRKTPIYKSGNHKDAIYPKPPDAKRQSEYRKRKKILFNSNIKKSGKEINHHELIKWVFKCQSSNIINTGKKHLKSQATSQQS